MKGFTLIELLVVVVIIGILSSIALPQYEVVVEKSRAAEAMINAKAIQDAIQRHIQEFPDAEGVTNRSQIADVQLKGGKWNSAGNVFTTKHFTYKLGGDSGKEFEVLRSDQGHILYSVVYNSVVDDEGQRVKSVTNSDDKYGAVLRLFND